MGRRNPLEFLAEFAGNIIDPQRQQFRRAQTLQGQRESARAQSAASRQETVNVAGIEEANIRASSALAVERERAKQAQNKVLADIFSNTGLPINTRGLAGERLLGQGSIRRLPGPGPTAFDPVNFNRQTGLEVAQGLQATGAGAESSARAAEQVKQTSALGSAARLAEFLGRTGELSFIDPGTRFSGAGAERIAGARAPEATPANQVQAATELRQLLGLRAGVTQTTPSPFGGAPVVTTTEGVRSPDLDSAIRLLQDRLGIPASATTPTTRRSVNDAADDLTLEEILEGL